MLSASAIAIAEATGGVLVAGSGDTVATAVAIDSRDVVPGAAFFALHGEHADGHDFLAAALDAGARVLVVTCAPEDLGTIAEEAVRAGAAIVSVEDGVVALQALARWHRSRLRCPVVALTGSTGKTTTKDFLAAVLGTSQSVVATAGNKNNELGVPLTLLGAGATCDVLVVEMGMRGVGQIAELCELARPTLGLVTNVGYTHLEVVGSGDAIVAAKGELVAAIPADGAVFLNGDDARSLLLEPLSKAPVIYYGLSDTAEVTARDIELDSESRASFDLVAPDGVCERVSLPIPGRHNVYNALAAAVVALRLGIEPTRIAEGLAGTRVTAMRMEVFSAASGVTVVNDAYNANPTSMRAAVETLAAMQVDGRKVAVLGDMAELGSLADLAHFGLGEAVAHLGIDVLVTVGRLAARIAEGARAEAMPDANIRPCATATEALEVLDDVLEPGDTVLVKASRVMGLEAVVEGIVSPRG